MIEFDLSKIEFIPTLNPEKTAYRLINPETGKQFGEFFQELLRTPEYKSSMIIYQKYKNLYNLSLKDLENITNFCISFKKERELLGKKCSNDFLTQKASEFIQSKYKNEKLDH